MVKEGIGRSITLPFQHVKESFEVRGSPSCTRVSYEKELQAETLTTTSVVATCLEELPELSKDGVDEEVIRDVGGTIFLGEHHCHAIT